MAIIICSKMKKCSKSSGVDCTGLVVGIKYLHCVMVLAVCMAK